MRNHSHVPHWNVRIVVHVFLREATSADQPRPSVTALAIQRMIKELFSAWQDIQPLSLPNSVRTQDE